MANQVKNSMLNVLKPGTHLDIQGTTYEICNVPGDGNCFFHCLSLATDNNLYSSYMFRNLICARILHDWDIWQHKITLCFGPTVTNVQYYNSMLRSNGWATACEVEAASELLSSNITVWLAGEDVESNLTFTKVSYTTTNQNQSNDIHLLLKHNHFMLLKSLSKGNNNQIQSDHQYCNCSTDNNVFHDHAYISQDSGTKRKSFSQNVPSSLQVPRQTNCDNANTSDDQMFYAVTLKNISVDKDLISSIPTNDVEIGYECENLIQNDDPSTHFFQLETETNSPLYVERTITVDSTNEHCNNIEPKHIINKPHQSNNSTHTKYDMVINACRKIGISYELPVDADDVQVCKNWCKNKRRQIKRKECKLGIKSDALPEPPPLTCNDQLDNAFDRIRAFEIEQMGYKLNTCSVCQETKLELQVDKDSICKRCKSDKESVKMFSTDNNMDPGVQPDDLSDLTIVEQQLISRISPCLNVHMLKHGGIASSGHCVTFPQEVNEPARIFPLLPQEIQIIKVSKKGLNNSTKELRVRREKVQKALEWLKSKNPAYHDIAISQYRLSLIPLDGELDAISSVICSDEGAVINDKGPAPEQLEVDNIEDCNTDSGVLLQDVPVNVKEKVEKIVKEVIGEHANVTQNSRGTLTIPWPTRHNDPLSEFTTRNFFTLAFPCLFPYGTGDFNINRPRTCNSLEDWAEHLLWFKDGRFARHPYFKFVIHNMILRKQTLERGNFVVKQALGDAQMSIQELKNKLTDGNSSIASKILYFSNTLRGSSQYWAQRNRELRALLQLKINNEEGLPAFFTTGSCAEFHFKPLRRLLAMYTSITTNCNIDPDKLTNSELFDLLQKNTHIVGQYFDLRTKSYFENVMGPVFGVDTFWYRQEFAKSRGMIHWHGFCWRKDRQPHTLMNECISAGLTDSQCAEQLSDWAKHIFGLTALHPAGSDEKGSPRKNMWPPPEGTAPAPPEEKNPLLKLLMDVSESQSNLLEDYLLLTNRFNLHRCSDYCLRKKNVNSSTRHCRMEFGSEEIPGKSLRTLPDLVHDKNSCLRLEMERDHPMLVQNSRFHTQGWRANGDISLIVSKSPPENPSINEIIAIEKYVTSYACKGNQSSDSLSNLFNDMANCATEESTGNAKSICNKFLMNTVKRDVSAVEATYEISRLPLFRSSHQFKTISLSGFRLLERNGDVATRSTALDKYINRIVNNRKSFYQFTCSNSNIVPVFTGITQASWPLDETYCKNMLILHFPNWRLLSDLKNDNISWIESFEQFISSEHCPNFVKADVERAKRHRPGQESLEGEEDQEHIVSSQQPDWADVLQPQPDFNIDTDDVSFDDWGESFNWSSTIENYPEDLGAHFFEDLCQTTYTEHDNSDLILPNVDLNSLNEEQLFAFNIVMDTLFKVHNGSMYKYLRLIVSGTAGSGKSYLIKCIVKAARLLFDSNNSAQVVCPTGNSANIIDGVTLHSFLKIPITNAGQEMCPPQGPTADALQSNLTNLKVLLVDERSLIGVTNLGWMEYMCRCGMEKGEKTDQSWGSLPVVVFLGDDVQLPPVLDCPVYKQNKKYKPASLHGSIVWKEFDKSVDLKTIVRQNDSETKLKEVLMSLRDYKATPSHAKWLQQFQWDFLKASYGIDHLKDMERRGLFVFPTYTEVWCHNKAKLININAATPVALIKAVLKGSHSKSIQANKAGGLLPKVYIARGAKVMLTVNLAVKLGLFNGAMGVITDIIYKTGQRPMKNTFPEAVMVKFPGYSGPPFLQQHPKVIPILPIIRKIDCPCAFCKIKQLPLRLGWATTIHKCQGMTIGEGEPNRYIIINPGTRQFEARNPGGLFVSLSRAKSTGSDDKLPDFAWHPSIILNEDRICYVVNTPTTIARNQEIRRLKDIESKTRTEFQHLIKNRNFIQLISQMNEE